MSSYLLHDRYLKLYRGNEINKFPGTVKIIIKLLPGDAFGVNDNKPRTTFKKGVEYHYSIDERDGSVEIADAFLETLQTILKTDNSHFALDGNILSIIRQFNSKDELLRYIHSANQILPAIISCRFQTFIWISEFKVIHENGLYHFFVSRIRPTVTVTTEEHAVNQFNDSIKQWLSLTEGEERIVVAYYYYRQALRLSKIEPAPQTMIPEVILNLAKSLEISLSADRDQFRKIANEIGIENDFIETKLIPILCLRNELGIAHVSTTPFTIEQKDTVQKFMMSAFNNVQFALNIIFTKIKEGAYKLGPMSTEPDKIELRLLKRIEEYLSLPDKEPL